MSSLVDILSVGSPNDQVCVEISFPVLGNLGFGLKATSTWDDRPKQKDEQ